MTAFVSVSGEILRLLASVAIPSQPTEDWAPEWTPLTLEEAVVNKFAAAICAACELVPISLGIMSQKPPPVVASKRSDFVTTDQFAELVVLLARMMQFVLRFDGVWTAKVKGLMEESLQIQVATIMVSASAFRCTFYDPDC